MAWVKACEGLAGEVEGFISSAVGGACGDEGGASVVAEGEDHTSGRGCI